MPKLRRTETNFDGDDNGATGETIAEHDGEYHEASNEAKEESSGHAEAGASAANAEGGSKCLPSYSTTAHSPFFPQPPLFRERRRQKPVARHRGG